MRATPFSYKHPAAGTGVTKLVTLLKSHKAHDIELFKFENYCVGKLHSLRNRLFAEESHYYGNFAL